MASRTANSITLTAINGAEYRLSTGTWQSSPVFNNLDPAKSYTFYARLKETSTQNASPESDESTAFTTDKAAQSTPSAPTMAGRTANSVTLDIIPGAEYRVGTLIGEMSDWQDSNVFTGLEPNRMYNFFARMKETDTHNASIGNSARFTTLKAEQTKPDAPTFKSKTADSITLNAIDGAEYRLSVGGEWQDSNIFTGLKPNESYTFYARMKETLSHNASPVSGESDTFTTDKADQSAPPTPTMASKTADSITLKTITGAEYRLGTTGAWQTSPTFGGLDSNASYIFYARLTATDTHNISPVSLPSAAISINKVEQSAPAAPTMADKTADNVTLTVTADTEYRLGTTGAWQTSPTFNNLDPCKTYSFYARLKATDTHNASPASEPTEITTNKGEQSAPSAPTMKSKLMDKITLNTITGAEYRLGATGEWQDSPEFKELTSGTEYTFYARMKATDTHNASPASLATDKSATTVSNASTATDKSATTVSNASTATDKSATTASNASTATDKPATTASNASTATDKPTTTASNASTATDKSVTTAPATTTNSATTTSPESTTYPETTTELSTPVCGNCDRADCDVCSEGGKWHALGDVDGNEGVTIFDALEVLKRLVKMDCAIDKSEGARHAALITQESINRGEPSIFDALEILKKLVNMDTCIDGVHIMRMSSLTSRDVTASNALVYTPMPKPHGGFACWCKNAPNPCNRSARF